MKGYRYLKDSILTKNVIQYLLLSFISDYLVSYFDNSKIKFNFCLSIFCLKIIANNIGKYFASTMKKCLLFVATILNDL